MSNFEKLSSMKQSKSANGDVGVACNLGCCESIDPSKVEPDLGRPERKNNVFIMNIIMFI